MTFSIYRLLHRSKIPKTILLLILTFIVLQESKVASQSNELVARKGVIDLSNWSFELNGPANLDGEWEFYWDELYFSEDFRNGNNLKNKGYIKVPLNWKGVIVGEKEIPSKGCATYRLKVLLDTTIKKIMIHYPILTTTMTIYSNGVKVAHNGEVTKNQDKSSPKFILENSEFEIKDTELEIIIHIANYHQVKGGIFASIKLGNENQIKNLQSSQQIRTSFLIGCFLLIVIFHLILYLLRPKDKSSLYFALSSFGFFLYFSIINGIVSFLFPELEFAVLFRLVLISLSVIVGFFFLFVYSLYNKDYNKIAIHIIFWSNALIIIMSFLPTSFLYKPFLSIYSQTLLFIASTYTLGVVLLALKRKRDDAVAFIIGFGVFTISMINDTLNNMNVISSIYIVEFGLLAFFLVQSYIISARFSRAFKLSESLTVELKDINENLEDLVIKRTHKIEQQKEEIQTQNEQLVELDRFKQDMTSMIVHDLKNPLNTILHASDSEIEESRDNEKGIIRSTGRQMLNMVLNILDVNKFEETNVHLNIKKNSLTDIFNSAAEQVPYLLEQKNIQLIDRTPNSYFVICDKEIIERVFVNLLTNAIKYSPHNSKIELLAHPANTESVPKGLEQIELNGEIKDYLLIAVKDYASGMKKEVVSKVFQKFKQIEATDSGSTKSTGLGLTFCKLAVEAHNGEIGAISEPNKGSVFWFTLKMDTEIKEKKIEITPIVKDESLILTEEERSKLKNYLTNLNQLEFYEVTSIKKILAKIGSDSSNSIKEWKNKVELAVKNCNEKEYEKLIKSV